MREDQNTVAKWAQDTFGNFPTPLRIVIRANLESTEMLEAAAEDKWIEVPSEAADIAIVMYRLADKLSVNIDAGYRTLAPKPRKKVKTIVAVQRVSALLADISHLFSLEDRPYFFVPGVNEPTSGQYVSQVQQVSMLMAWLFVWLDEICLQCNTKLQDEIDKKMEINRKRDWDVRGGEGFHK